jgi:hypothetical protein
MTMYDDPEQFNATLGVAMADTIEKYKQILAAHHSVVFNYLVADVNGNVYYLSNNKTPIRRRPKGLHWAFPMPGWTSATDWTGFVPIDNLPNITNPHSGIVHVGLIPFPDIVDTSSYQRGSHLAFSPHIMAWGGRPERMRVLRSVCVKGRGEPGQLLDNQLTVACGNQAVRLTRVQRAGKRPMSGVEFLRGFPLAKGTHFG